MKQSTTKLNETDKAIYYKIGDGKMRKLTILKHIFFPQRYKQAFSYYVDTIGTENYSVKENISYINFYNTFDLNNIVIIGAKENTKVNITIGKDCYSHFCINAKDVEIRIQDENELSFVAKITGAAATIYFNSLDFTVNSAKRVSLQGQIPSSNRHVPISNIKITSKCLDLCNVSANIRDFEYKGDKLTLDGVTGKMENMYTTAQEVSVKNSSINSVSGCFVNCSNPIFEKSVWSFEECYMTGKYLTQNDETKQYIKILK